MTRKHALGIWIAILILLGGIVGYYFFSRPPVQPRWLLTRAVKKELKLTISTNGIIEPADRIEIYAPIDGFVAGLKVQEGDLVGPGQPLMRLESQAMAAALIEARAALLQAQREAQLAAAGPPQEELAAADLAIAETGLQLRQLRQDQAVEEDLLKRGATTVEAVENLRKQIGILELRSGGLQQKKLALLNRYSAEEKRLLQGRVQQLTHQVELLDRQMQTGLIQASVRGSLYSLSVREGVFVSKGQLLAQFYQTERIRLRAYVDEPDLGRVEKGQPVVVEWDGLPQQQWTGVVEKLAGQVVAMGNRSVGYVLCSIAGDPGHLIPNLNVKVQIVTASKASALVVPRTAVFNQDGKPAVMLSDGVTMTLRQVVIGMVTAEEIEIVQGIDEGSTLIANPVEAGLR